MLKFRGLLSLRQFLIFNLKESGYVTRTTQKFYSSVNIALENTAILPSNRLL
jgi:hypothetical protein